MFVTPLYYLGPFQFVFSFRVIVAVFLCVGGACHGFSQRTVVGATAA